MKPRTNKNYFVSPLTYITWLRFKGRQHLGRSPSKISPGKYPRVVCYATLSSAAGDHANKIAQVVCPMLAVAAPAGSKLNRVFSDIACGTVPADSVSVRHNRLSAVQAAELLGYQLAAQVLADPCGSSVRDVASDFSGRFVDRDRCPKINDLHDRPGCTSHSRSLLRNPTSSWTTNDLIYQHLKREYRPSLNESCNTRLSIYESISGLTRSTPQEPL